MKTKVYILGRNTYDGKIMNYRSKEEASLQGVISIEIEASTFHEAIELYTELYIDNTNEE